MVGGGDVLAASDVVRREMRVPNQPFAEVVSAGKGPEESRIGGTLILGVLHNHAHLAPGPLQTGGDLQRDDVFRIGAACTLDRRCLASPAGQVGWHRHLKHAVPAAAGQRRSRPRPG